MTASTTPDAAQASDTRAFLLSSGASQAAFDMACLSSVTALALEALANNGSEDMGTGTDEALTWLASRLRDAGETLCAIIEARPARWHTGADAASDAGRALAMLGAQPPAVLDTPGLRAAMDPLDAAKGGAE
jgi:hypothetical protein